MQELSKICFTIPQLLTPTECADLIAKGEAGLYLPTGTDYPASYRDNDRLVLDDPVLSELLSQRLSDRLPRTLEHEGVDWTLQGLNTRFRGCRYTNGQSFRRHRDGAYSPSEGLRSFLTVMLYLNDHTEFEGGATRFYADRFIEKVDFEIPPQQGQAIVFSHSCWHDGQAVTHGAKYVLRTDVLYQASVSQPLGHRGYVWDIMRRRNGEYATGSRDTTVRLWKDLNPTSTLEGHEASVTTLAEVADTLYSGSRDRSIIRWGANAAERRWVAHDGAVLRLLGLSDGKLLSSGADGMVKRWSQTGQELAKIDLGSWPWAMVALKGGRCAVGTEAGALWILEKDLSKSTLVQKIETPILALAEDLQGTLFLGCGDGKLRRLNRQFQNLGVWSGHRGPVTSLAVLSQGSVVSGGEDDGVRLWNAGQSVELARHQDFVRALCVTPDDQVVSVSYDGRLHCSEVPSSPLNLHLSSQ